MQDNHSFKAYLPGGASGGILHTSMDNVPLDFDTLQEMGVLVLQLSSSYLIKTKWSED